MKVHELGPYRAALEALPTIRTRGDAELKIDTRDMGLATETGRYIRVWLGHGDAQPVIVQVSIDGEDFRTDWAALDADDAKFGPLDEAIAACEDSGLLRLPAADWPVRKVRHMPPRVPRPPGVRALKAVELPKVRDRLQRYVTGPMVDGLMKTPPGFPVWLPGADAGQPDEWIVQASRIPREHAQAFCRRLANGLETADLYWVSDEFTTLALEAAMDLPDLTFSAADMPSPEGLVYFDRAILVTGGHPGGGVTLDTPRHQTHVVALSWFTVPGGGVWVTLYAQPDQMLGPSTPNSIPANVIRDQIGFLIPISPGGGQKFARYELSENPKANQTLGVLLATWFLISQPGVAEQSPGPVDKAVRRSYERRGRQHPNVRVVNLRRRPVPAGREAAQAGRSYSVRFMVSGHWRDQPYGPQRSLRRRQYIAPYLKGPQDAPLKAEAAVVRTLR